MTQALAVASAVLFGLGDFTGGLVTRRLSVWRVTLWSQIAGLALLMPGLVIIGWTEVTVADMAWGALAGFFGLVGLVILYSTLAKGSMAVVAPITGASAAAIPVAVDVMAGTSLSTTQTAGIALAIVAIVLIGADRSSESANTSQVWWAVAAGTAFALFFIVLSNTTSDSGLWPLVGARAVSIPIALVIALVKGVAAPPRGRDLGLVATVGLLDMAANIAIALALQRGSLAINAVLSSLYPAVTALLAVFILHERPKSWQWAGIAVATLAVVILAV